MNFPLSVGEHFEEIAGWERNRHNHYSVCDIHAMFGKKSAHFFPAFRCEKNQHGEEMSQRKRPKISYIREENFFVNNVEQNKENIGRSEIKKSWEHRPKREKKVNDIVAKIAVFILIAATNDSGSYNCWKQ